MCEYALVRWLSLLSLLMSAVDSGVLTSLFAYIGNEFALDEQGRSAEVYAVYAVLMAVAVVCTGALLPCLKLRRDDEIHIMLLAVAGKVLALALLASVSLLPAVFRNMGVLYASAVCYGMSFVVWPSIPGLLSRYVLPSQQGAGFGILDAWTAVASVVAPFSFGALYGVFEARGLQWLLFAMAMALCAAAMLILAYPLRRAVAEQTEVMVFAAKRRGTEEEEMEEEMEIGALI